MLTLNVNLLAVLNGGTELLKLAVKAYLFANTTNDALIQLAMVL